MSDQDGDISYFIDANDHIVKVSGPWDEFALDNEGPGACVQAIVGKSLTSFIAGDVSKMFINTMLMSARVKGQPISRPYRCDSGRLKRFMEMSIVPLPDGGLEVKHRLLRSEPLYSYQFIPAKRVGSSGAVRTKRCSMCNKVAFGSEWFEIEAALEQGVLPTEHSHGPWIFGVCPPCLGQAPAAGREAPPSA